MSLVFIDIETTGLIPENDDIIELSAVRVENGKIGKKFDSLVQPYKEIPEEIEKLTGIKNEEVKNAPILSKVRTDFTEKFLKPGDILVAHNSAFDIGFLNQKEFDLEYPEIDTFDLATLLLPDEQSYSLEVLANKFNIKHENAHRAMADVMATIGVWRKLQEKTQKEWNKKLFQKISIILKKSEWPGKVFFEEIAEFFEKKEENPQNSLFDVENIQTNTVKFTTEEEKISSLIAEKIEKGKKRAIEIPASISQKNLAFLIAQKNKEKTIITGKKNPGLTIFDAEENFICKNKLEEFNQKESFNKIETTTLLKATIHDKNHISELHLKGEEISIFYKYLSQKNHENCPEECPAKNAIQEAKNVKNIFIPFSALHLFEGGDLIITNADELDNNLTNIYGTRSASKYFERLNKKVKTQSQSRFLDGLFFGFGLVAKYARERTQQSNFPESFKIIAQDEHSVEFKNFAEGFNEAKKELKNLFPDEDYLIQELENWQNFFQEKAEANNIKILTVFPDNSVGFSNFPVDLKKHINDLTENKNSTILLANVFAKNPEIKELSFPFYGLGFDYQKFEPDFDYQNNGFFIAPANGKNGNERSIDYITEQIEFLKKINIGNIFSILASQTMVKRIKDLLDEKNIDTIARNMGSIGKTAGMFSAQNGNKIALVTFNQAGTLLKKIDEHFSIYYLQKFAFDPPKQPLLEARQALFNNGFMDFALPRAIQRFLKIFYLAISKKEPFVFFCADPKITQNNSWGNHFFTALPEELPKKFLDQEKIEEIVKNFLKNKQD